MQKWTYARFVKAVEEGRGFWKIDPRTGKLRIRVKDFRITSKSVRFTRQCCPITLLYLVRTGNYLCVSRAGTAGEAIGIPERMLGVIIRAADNFTHELHHSSKAREVRQMMLRALRPKEPAKEKELEEAA